MAWLSAHIWNISIEGNLSQTDDVIFEYLENEGVSHGMWKNQVDTQKLSEQIRMYFTQFSWVSADLKGTRLIIYVREGTLSALTEDDATESAGGIAAAKAGTVVSIYVRKGRASVAVGDEVEAGDMLVSGQIPVYSDDGTVISWQSVNADADILLRTETDYYEELAFKTTLKDYTGRERVYYLLRFGGYSFALPGGFRKTFDLFDLTGEITQLQLSENFYLPVYFYKYTAKEYESLQYSYTEEQARQILESHLSDYMENLTEKGVQIFQNNVTIDVFENVAVARGSLITDECAVVRAEDTAASQDMQEEEPSG